MNKRARESSIFYCLVSLVLALSLPSAFSRDLKREILNIRINMAKAEARERLQNIGKLVREEAHRQEVWEVRDKSISHLILGFDAGDAVRYVTAVVREDKDSKRIAYREIGDLKEARQTGDPAIKNFAYEWSLPADRDASGLLVTARGRDPKFLATYSLKRVGGNTGREEED